MDFPIIVRLVIVVSFFLFFVGMFVREWYLDWRIEKEIDRLEKKVYTEMHS